MANSMTQQYGQLLENFGSWFRFRPTVWDIIFIFFGYISAHEVYPRIVRNWQWWTLSPALRSITSFYTNSIKTLVFIAIYGVIVKPIAFEFVVDVHAFAAAAIVPFLMMHVVSTWLDRHVENLQAQVLKLRCLQEVLRRLDPLQSSEICNEWLNSVDDLQRRVERIKVGYYGCRMNILKGRSFSLEAREELNRANDLLMQRDNLLNPQKQLRGTMNLYKQMVLDFILDMSPKSGMLGIWGVGGVGKSSLLKLVCDARPEYDGDGSFRVMFVRAGIGCTVGQVQEAIATSMELPLRADEASQAKIIHDHLKDTSFLLMLDDLWGYIDLEAVGIPWPLGIYGHKGLERQRRRKVVLTTRNMDLCEKMECLCGYTFQMECFYEEDAWRIYLLLGRDKLLPEKSPGKVVVQGDKWLLEKPTGHVGAAQGDGLLLEKPSSHDVGVQGDKLLPEKPSSHDVTVEKSPGKVVVEGDKWLLEKPTTGHVGAAQGDELLPEKPSSHDVGVQGDKLLPEKPSSSSWTMEQWVRTQPYTVVFDARYPGMMYPYRRVRHFIEAKRSSLLGVWGKRGVGKSALLRLVRDSYMGNDCFDHIMLLGAGTGSSMVNNVQHAIAISLGFNLDVMSSSDEVSRGRYIYDYLYYRSYLLLLDDIREPINWRSVGLPTWSSRHKIIFATRSRAGCALMSCSYVDTIEMQCLGKVDAWNLFAHKVGPEIVNDHCQVIYHLAEQMVSMCGGLPLALCALGRAMSNKKEPREWRSAYSQLTAMRLKPREIDEKVADLILNPHLVPPAIDEQPDTAFSDEMIKSITMSGSGLPRNQTDDGGHLRATNRHYFYSEPRITTIFIPREIYRCTPSVPF